MSRRSGSPLSVISGLNLSRFQLAVLYPLINRIGPAVIATGAATLFVCFAGAAGFISGSFVVGALVLVSEIAGGVTLLYAVCAWSKLELASERAFDELSRTSHAHSA